MSRNEICVIIRMSAFCCDKTGSSGSIPAALRRLYQKKLTSIRDGNISYKPMNKNYFYITPSSKKRGAKGKDRLTSEDIITINLHEESNSFSFDIFSANEPSSETPLHANIHLNRLSSIDDIYIIHCHAPNILAYVNLTHYLQLRSIQRYFPELSDYSIGDNVQYFASGSDELAIVTCQNLKNNDIVALENHGVVAIGTNLDDIINMIEHLDFHCAIALNDSVRMYHN